MKYMLLLAQKKIDTIANIIKARIPCCIDKLTNLGQHNYAPVIVCVIKNSLSLSLDSDCMLILNGIEDDAYYCFLAEDNKGSVYSDIKSVYFSSLIALIRSVKLLEGKNIIEALRQLVNAEVGINSVININNDSLVFDVSKVNYHAASIIIEQTIKVCQDTVILEYFNLILDKL
jgi:hypothetical protein